MNLSAISRIKFHSPEGKFKAFSLGKNNLRVPGKAELIPKLGNLGSFSLAGEIPALDPSGATIGFFFSPQFFFPPQFVLGQGVIPPFLIHPEREKAEREKQRGKPKREKPKRDKPEREKQTGKSRGKTREEKTERGKPERKAGKETREKSRGQTPLCHFPRGF